MNKPEPARNPSPLRLVERARPHNRHAEEVVLGTLINFPEKITEVADSLQPDDFYVVLHRTLYEIMLAYYRKHGTGADYLTLADILQRRQERFEKEQAEATKRDDLGADDLTALLTLSEEIWSPDLSQDIRLITGPAAQNRVINASLKLAEIGWHTADPDALRGEVEKLFFELGTARQETSDFALLDDVLVECVRDIDYATLHRGALLGVPTGFTDLDLMTSGLQRSDLILLAARPGFGKTSLGMGIAHNAARTGNAVAVFSLEMGAKQLAMRLLSLESGVPSNRLRTGWLTEGEARKLADARDCLGELPIYIDDTAGTPVTSITSKLRRLSARIHRSIDLVVVDYLQLMEEENETAAQRDNRNQELSRISRGLKLLARNFNVPVLALAQLSRAVETRQNKVPQLSDLRDSGALEQDADIVMFIYRDEMYNAGTDRKGLADVIVAKHRNGPLGSVTLRFNSALTRFDNCETTIYEEDTDGQ